MNRKRFQQPGKKFVNPLNKHIGRRTGRNFRAEKQIRVGEHGLENFDDYLSESDADSICMSDIRERSERPTNEEKENETSSTNSIMYQSVPVLDKVSMVSNSTRDIMALSQNSQISVLKQHSRFDWLRNRNIGRRTGKDMRANKHITLNANGLENFDDYFSESDAESFLSAPSQKSADRSTFKAISRRSSLALRNESKQTDKTADDTTGNIKHSESLHENDTIFKQNQVKVQNISKHFDVDDDHKNQLDGMNNEKDKYQVEPEEIVDESNQNDGDESEEDEGHGSLDDYDITEENEEVEENTEEEEETQEDEGQEDEEVEECIEEEDFDQEDEQENDTEKHSAVQVESNAVSYANEREDNDYSDDFDDQQDAKGDQSNVISPTQCLNGLDVAGNKSGSITKLGDPGSTVSFNKTKKRLSYSALEASEESKKARAQRLQKANTELANQDFKNTVDKEPVTNQQSVVKKQPSQKKHNQIKDKDTVRSIPEDDGNDFLCLSTRSVQVTHYGHDDQTDDEDTDITIIDDTKSKASKRKVSTTATGTSQRKGKQKTSENISNKSGTGKLKETESALKTKKSKSARKSLTKQGLTIQTVKSVNEVEITLEKSGIRSKKSVKKKVDQTNRKLEGDLLNNLDVDSEDDNEHDASNSREYIDCHSPESDGHINDIQLHGNGKRAKTVAGKGSVANESKSKSKKKGKSPVKRKGTDDSPIDVSSPSKKRQTSRKNTGKSDVKQKSTRSVNSAPKRKSTSEESTDKESDRNNVTTVSKKKKITKHSAKNRSQKVSDNTVVSSKPEISEMISIQTPEPDSRQVPTNLQSGVSFRVARRSELLGNITSGPHRRESEIEVEMEPCTGLTPCISRTGQSRKSKGRRVTICPEENQQHVLSADEATLEEIKSGKNIFRHSTRLSDVGTPLPSVDSTPVHIFECTRTERPDSPESISKLPRGYHELPVENRCIYPEPAPDGLRRSQRVRLKPVAHYKNEEIIWEYFPDEGQVMVGVKPSMETVYLKREELKRKKRKIKNAIKKATTDKGSKKSKRKLSIHKDLPKDFHPVEKEDITIIDPYTQEEDGIECLAYRDSFMAVGPNGTSPKSDDPFRITKVFDQPCMSAGRLEIMPLCAKPESRVNEEAVLFHILTGKMLVKIHNTTALLETDDSFFVPFGNVYSLTNLRNDKAELFYTVHKFQENSQLQC